MFPVFALEITAAPYNGVRFVPAVVLMRDDFQYRKKHVLHDSEFIAAVPISEHKVCLDAIPLARIVNEGVDEILDFCFGQAEGESDEALIMIQQ